MKKIITFTATVLMTGVIYGADAVHDSHADHDSAHHEETALKLNNGKKWETDAPLRQGMGKIKDLMSANLNQIHNRKADEQTYKRVADGVDSQIQFLFKNCKLSPEADAQLHLVIAKMMMGSQSMKEGKKLDDRRAGAVKIIQALDDYGTYFNHPGWKPIKH